MEAWTHRLLHRAPTGQWGSAGAVCAHTLYRYSRVTFGHVSEAMWFLCLMVARVPTGLPDSLEFRRVGAAELRTELQPLLQTSYVATPDDELRLDYSARDLAWMLDAPGAREELRVGLGCRDEAGLIGFVCAVPCGLLVRGEQVDAVEVSLLCMHRDWRRRGLTKELILELRRRADAAGIRCAIFTEARPRHTLPLLRAECYHRPLRARALLRYGFWRPPAGDEGGDALEQSRRQLHAAADLASQLVGRRETAAEVVVQSEAGPSSLWGGCGGCCSVVTLVESL